MCFDAALGCTLSIQVNECRLRGVLPEVCIKIAKRML
jgi:hypothetical protein